MKKLIIVLMVVAVASFLFVGCLGVTPPADDVDDVDDVVDVAKTDTPYITEIDGGNVSLYSTDTQYASGATVEGVGVAGAVIKSYINGVQAGVSNSGTSGSFEVTVSMLKLVEGVTKLYVTATVPGLAESDKSTEYTFTVDLTAPKIASAIADSNDTFITVTFNEAVKAAVDIGTTDDDEAEWDMSALNTANWTITPGTATKFVATSSKVIRITLAGTIGTTGTGFSLICTGIGDSLGNTIKTTAPSTYVGVVTD